MIAPRRAFVVAVLAILACLTTIGPATVTSQQPPAPKLVVIVVVDQLRPDYFDRHRKHLTGGFDRLLREGAVFENAAYPYLNTVTCAGHATIGTGALPFRHGMILNAWYDRSKGASTACTDDPSVKNLSYAGLAGSGHSGTHLLVPTLADRIRERARGRVATVSLKPRSAIGLAGHGGDVVLWFDERGGFATSTAFARRPVPFIASFLQQNPVTATRGRIWDRLLPAAEYHGDDDVAMEQPPRGWTRTFPHQLDGEDAAQPTQFFSQWARTPFADEYVARLAMHSVDALKLGQRRNVDFLGISFSTLDMIGHGFGPGSHEVQDIVLRLDRTLGQLLDHLDTAVGKGNYVLALSADHGVSAVPETVPGAGRHTSTEIRAVVDAALTPFFGPPPAPPAKPGATTPARGSYVVYTAYTDLYLADGVMERLRREPKALAAVLDALRKMPGMIHAFNGDDLVPAEARNSDDPAMKAAALNYHPGRSGDLIVVPRENWILSSAAATHGTLHAYDQRVPVIFYGAGVEAGRHQGTATPADIVPTLARLARVPVPVMDGRALLEAPAPAPARGR